MNFSEIQDRLTAMNEALIDKGYVRPSCRIDVPADSDATIWIETARDGDISGVWEYVEGSDFEALFHAAEEKVNDLSSVEHHKKKEAVKQFGRAVDGLRSAGFEAEFTDPLSEQLQAMTENLLTDQRAAQ